jgi:hypothetical protein
MEMEQFNALLDTNMPDRPPGSKVLDIEHVTTLSEPDDASGKLICHGTFEFANGLTVRGTLTFTKNIAGDPITSWHPDFSNHPLPSSQSRRTRRSPRRHRKSRQTKMSNRSITTAKRTIITGVGRDLHDLRGRSGLTLRAVAGQVDWGIGGFNTLARYERGTPKDDDDDSDPGIRMISVGRYFELLKFYFFVLPKRVTADHPAAPLTGKRYSAALERLSTATLFQFAEFIRAMRLGDSIKDEDPYIKLVYYLQNKGMSALLV